MVSLKKTFVCVVVACFGEGISVSLVYLYGTCSNASLCVFFPLPRTRLGRPSITLGS